MAPAGKNSESRRKSAGGNSLTVTLHASPDKLREILEPQPASEQASIKDSPEPKDKEDDKEATELNGSPAPANALAASAALNGDNASDSSPATPAVNEDGTPVPGAMGPPNEGPKKKGTKRSAGAANGVGPDGQPKVRGKPGPKKKAKLDDGTIDPNGGGKTGGGPHKLGPKANQGAINAGLRALDRSGKPCRKWNKGGFTLKSFTGVVWEIPRWTAPPKILPQEPSDDSAAVSAADSSSKENKEALEQQIKSDANSFAPNSASNSNVDGDARSRPESVVPASSPAPTPVPAAS